VFYKFNFNTVSPPKLKVSLCCCCFTAHFNSLNLTYQLMHFHIQ
jgi:hypothetical protein